MKHIRFFTSVIKNMFLPQRNVFLADGGAKAGAEVKEVKEAGKEEKEISAQDRLKQLREKIDGYLKDASATAKLILQNIKDKLSESWETTKTYFEKNKDQLTETVRSQLTRFFSDPKNAERAQEVKSAVETVQQRAETAYESIKAKLQELFSRETARDIRTSIQEAITWLEANGEIAKAWLVTKYRTEVAPTATEIRDYIKQQVPSIIDTASTRIEEHLRSYLPAQEGPRETDTATPEAINRRNVRISQYENELLQFPQIPSRPVGTSQNETQIQAYFGGLRDRLTSVRQSFATLQTDLLRTHNVQPRQMTEAEKENIVRITQDAMRPVEDAMKDPTNLRDRERDWQTVAGSYFRLHDDLRTFGAQEITDAQITGFRNRMRQQLERVSRMETVDPETIDKKKNPLLYIITMLAKAFGVDVHIDSRTNAIVGWTGSNADKNVQFARVAGSYIEQHGWGAEFDRLEITNVNLRSKISNILLDNRCFPSNNVDQMLSGRLVKRLFMQEIAKFDTNDEQIVKINHALDHLSQHPLEIVNTVGPVEPGQLSINSLYTYIQDPESTAFYPPQPENPPSPPLAPQR